MIRRMRLLAPMLGPMLGLSLALAGCSNDPDQAGATLNTARAAVERIAGAVGGRTAGDGFGITRAGIRDYPDPLIVVTTETGRRAGLVWKGRNGPYARWETLDGASFVTRAGVLTGTRGFGYDLMAADVAQTVALVTARQPGQARRVHEWLNGGNDIVNDPYTCTITVSGRERIAVFEIAHDTTKMTERCNPAVSGAIAPEAPQGFENIYWVGTDGTVWRSSQRISEEAGRVILEQLLK